MATIQEAKEIIDGLRNRHGYLREKMMDDIGSFNPEYRLELKEQWHTMETAMSHSLRTFVRIEFEE
jgi:hypothetical protein